MFHSERDNHNNLYRKLLKDFELFKGIKFPLVGDASTIFDKLNNPEIDLAEEDGYFAGIIETYLKHKVINHPIRIDLSIRTRLKKAYILAGNNKQRIIIKRFVNYALRIESLARLLSQYSGKELIFMNKSG